MKIFEVGDCFILETFNEIWIIKKIINKDVVISPIKFYDKTFSDPKMDYSYSIYNLDTYDWKYLGKEKLVRILYG